MLTKIRVYADPGSVQEFKQKSIGLERNLAGPVKNFHYLDLGGISGVGWSSGGKLDGEKYDVNRECQMLSPDPYSFSKS